MQQPARTVRLAHGTSCQNLELASKIGNLGDRRHARGGAQRVASWLADPRTRTILTASRFRDAGAGVSVTGDKVTFVVDLGAPH